MKNYWLDKKDRQARIAAEGLQYLLDRKELTPVNEVDLNNAIISFKLEEANFLRHSKSMRTAYRYKVQELDSMFRNLVGTIFAFMSAPLSKIQWGDPAQVVEDCIKMCWERIDRFDPAKGKSHSYFTTIVLSNMRQAYRVERERKEQILKALDTEERR